MITLDLIRAGLVALMALPGMPFPGLCTLFFATMLLGPPFSAARSALLPDVLPRDRFRAASTIGNHTAQLGQIAGFLIGGGLVATLGPYRALALDSLSFSLSAGILACWVRPRPAPPRAAAVSPSPWEITWEGVSVVFGNPVLRTLVLFGWLAGFTVAPEGLAAPYAHALGRGPATVGLLMAAMPVGTVVGAFVIGRLMRPSDRMRPMGWLAMLSCAPLIFSLLHPSFPVVLLMLGVAGTGGAYQLAAAAAFVQALPAAGKVRAFAVAQSGLLAAQGLGILTAGVVAQRIGAQATVALAGLLGLLAAAALATDWIARHGQLIASLGTTLDRPQSAEPGTPLSATPAGSLSAGPSNLPGSLPVSPLDIALDVALDTAIGSVPEIALSAAPTTTADHPAAELPPPAQLPPAKHRPTGRPAAERPPAEPVPAERTSVAALPLARKRPHRGSTHRAPRDMPARARLAAARLLDQVLGDRATFSLLRDDDPGRQVHQREHPERHHGEGDEDKTDDGGVNADVLGDPGADTGHQPAFPRPD
jgi:predicted MFS family arabinose efflux permease